MFAFFLKHNFHIPHVAPYFISNATLHQADPNVGVAVARRPQSQPILTDCLCTCHLSSTHPHPFSNTLFYYSLSSHKWPTSDMHLLLTGITLSAIQSSYMLLACLNQPMCFSSPTPSAHIFLLYMSGHTKTRTRFLIPQSFLSHLSTSCSCITHFHIY